MAHDRHLSETKYFDLLRSIRDAGGVPCEDAPALFFPEDLPDPDLRDASVRVAKALCRKCPITEKCLVYALETNQRFGIWGATEGHERSI